MLRDRLKHRGNLSTGPAARIGDTSSVARASLVDAVESRSCLCPCVPASRLGIERCESRYSGPLKPISRTVGIVDAVPSGAGITSNMHRGLPSSADSHSSTPRSGSLSTICREDVSHVRPVKVWGEWMQSPFLGGGQPMRGSARIATGPKPNEESNSLGQPRPDLVSSTAVQRRPGTSRIE